MKIKTFLVLISFPLSLHASWLCREAASQARGNTFFACGYSESKNLMKAREGSLESAKREFKSFCNDSSNCRDHAYTMSPMRTDCFWEDKTYKCFRGVEYTILPEKQNYIFVDKALLNQQIKDKEQELSRLQSNLTDLNRLDSLSKQVEKFKALDKAEIDITELRHAYNNYQTKHNFGLFFGVHSLPLKNNNSTNADNIFAIGIGVEYQYQIWRNLFGKASASYIGSSGDDKVNDRGDANSKSEVKYHSHSGIDVNFGLPIIFKQFTLLPNAGFLAVSYNSTQAEYNNFGVLTKTIEDTHSYTSGYTGLGLRFGQKAYIGIEPRYYINDKKFGGTVNAGIMIDF